MENPLDLSIITVNWRSVDFLRKCLASIYANTKDLEFEIIVVDNASGDGCGEMLARKFPAVEFVQSPENLGFARANNLGFSHSSGQNLLFLNPDTEVIGAAVQVLLNALESLRDAGIVGPKLLNSDGSIQTSCIQRFPTIVNQVLDLDYLRTKFPKASLWGTRPLFEPVSAPVPVEVISGACLMIRRQIFEQVGLFTAHYFMYAEDVDLCFKAQQAGWKIYYVGQASVIHHGGGSTNAKRANTFSAVVMRESMCRFLRARRGKLYATAYQAMMALTAAARLVVAGTLFLLSLGRFRRSTLSAIFAKWAGVFRWAIGLEGWAKGLT